MPPKAASLTPSDQADPEHKPKMGGHLKAMQQAHKESHKIIKNYMQGRDIPEWFRGTSSFQGKAANRLNESLLYDMEQRSSHRVRACLIGMGLSPMIRNDEIKFLIKMSRANDLAFLWFLYEMHYKTKGPQYSINEQLILSTIAHLDMVPTLRELDRILPPGVKEKPKPLMKTKKVPIVNSNDVHIHGKLIPVKSPYLEPIHLPKPYSNVSTCEVKDLHVTLGEYDVWSDPNYVVPNEHNRWFAEYEPRAGRRVVHGILKEQIEDLFEDYEENLERVENMKVVCEQHKRIAEMQERLKVELQMIAREQCEKYFDVDGDRKERAQKRIKEQLDKDVQMFLDRFKTITEKMQPCGNKPDNFGFIDVLKPCEFHFDNLQSADEEAAMEDLSQPPLEEERGSVNLSIDEGGMGDFASERDKSKRMEGGENKSCSCSESSSDEAACSNKRFSMSCFHVADCDHKELGKKNATASGSTNHNKHKALRCEDGDDGEPWPPCSSEHYFVSAQKHQPWRFDYHKIFMLPHPYLEPEDVKELAAKAVDSEMSFQSKVETLAKPNMDKAVKKCVRRTWTRAVDDYNKENPTCACLKKMRDDAEREQVPIDFKRDTFDPNDTKFMTHMLKTAFEYMKKNPKFVLASLPEAYKLPSFVYFIEKRYGKRYTLKDRHRLYLESLKILRALEKLTRKIPMPQIQQFCTNTVVSYGCRDYLLAKANKIKEEYYEQLDNAIMRQARVFWFAMRPYLCSSGPPRNTYFAYMPSRSVDITRFRQWKSNEFMNAKGAWDRRQREARKRTFK